jgi:putative intracellular protease/amidase
MTAIDSASILILATDGYERSELRVPLEELKKRGANVKIASIKMGEIKSWDEKDWGDTVSVDLEAKDVKAEEFDALVLPGGQINPDLLRVNEEAVKVVRDFVKSGKPVAAICHGPWLLVERHPIIPSAPTSEMRAHHGRTRRSSSTTASSPPGRRRIFPSSSTRLSRRSRKALTIAARPDP